MIIANPTAGASAGRQARHRLLEAACNDFERHGIEFEVRLESDAKAVSDLAEQSVRAGYTRIVAAGGDGTVNAVVNGLMHLPRGTARYKDVTLGVLPFGTGNVFAFNLGIGKSWREACRIIRDGNTRVIDVGLASALSSGRGEAAMRSEAAARGETLGRGETAARVQKRRYFLLMAGIGFDAKVIEDTSLRLKYVLRDFAYVLRTLQNVVLHQGTQMTLTFSNGHTYADVSWLVMIGNAASYAWDIKVTTHARLDDGLVDVCLMPFENKLISIQQALQVLTGQHIDRGIAHYWKVEGVRVDSDPPVPVQLDGDEWGKTPVAISVVPAALRVFAPPETVAEGPA
jgi:YegS/Rv2252/BmrU family lipid kinase